MVPRQIVRLALLALLVPVSACTFDTTIPKSKKVRCGPKGECPATMTCVTEVGLCRKEGDSISPTVAATVNKSAFRTGEEVRVVAVASEVLRESPRLYALVAGKERAFDFEGPGADDVTFIFRTTVDASMAEGTFLVLADAEDLTGNPSVALRTGASFEVDNTPPAIDVARSAITPRNQRGGQSVAITLVTTEPVAPGARLIARVKGTPNVVADLTQAQSNATRLEFTLPIPEGAPSSLWSLSVTGLVDLAGNAATEAGSAAGDINIDGTAPFISPLGLVGLVRSAQPGFNTFDVPLKVNDPEARVTLCFSWSGCTTHDAGTTVTYVVKDTDPEGAQAITVQAEDSVGNRAAPVSETVLFDFTPPLLQGTARVELTPPALCPFPTVGSLGVGATATAFFAVNEDTTAPQVHAADAGWVGMASAPREYRYQFVADAGISEGAFTVAAKLRDLVGNEATRTLGQVTFDRTPPAPLAPRLLGRATLTRDPWGSEDSLGKSQVRFSADAGTFESNARAVLWDGTDFSTANPVAYLSAQFDGRVHDTVVSTFDRVNVYASQYDLACNRDGPAPSLVRNGEWVATLGGKVAGSSIENPHRFLSGTAEFPRAVNPSDALELGGTVLGRADGVLQRHAVTDPAILKMDIGTPPEGLLVWDRAEGKTMIAMGYLGAYGIAAHWDGSRLNARTGAAGPAIGFPGTLFYDESLGRVLSLGFEYGSASISLWAFDGHTYERLTPPHLPRLRESTAVAYDSVRKRAVLFGGKGLASSVLSDTWEWTGTDWLDVTPNMGASPPARSRHGMVWDPARQEVVIFGGSNQTGTYFSDLWSWNGQRWQSISTGAPRPSGRDNPVFTYDTARSVFVVAAGDGALTDGGTGAQPLSDTWELSGSTWTRRSASDPRWVNGCRPYSNGEIATTSAFDTVRGVTVAYCESQRSLYEWNGSAWTTGFTFGQQNSRRQTSAVHYWPARRSYIGVESDWAGNVRTWEWSDAGVTTHGNAQVAVNSARCSVIDEARSNLLVLDYADPTRSFIVDAGQWSTVTGTVPNLAGHACLIAYDRGRNRPVLFSVNDRSTWEWTGTAWLNRNPPLPWPEARSGGSLYYDTDRARTVYAGGLNGSYQPYANVWEWNGTVWTERVLPAPPPNHGFYAAGAGYDQTRKRGVLIEVNGNDVYANELSDAGWTSTPLTNDVNDRFVAVTYDSQMGSIVFGATTNASNAAFDLIRWNGTPSRRVTPGLSRPERYVSVTYDSARNVAVIYDGASTWEWAPTTGTWKQAADWKGTGPADRVEATLAYDPLTQAVLLYGGHVNKTNLYALGPSDFFTDTWQWNGTTWSQTLGSGSAPGPRRAASMVFNPSRSRIMLAGGAPFGGGAFEWTGTAWASLGNMGGGVDSAGRMAAVHNPARNAIAFSAGRRWAPDAGWTEVPANIFGEWTGTWTPGTLPSWAYNTSNESLGLAYDSSRQAVWVQSLLDGTNPNHPAVLFWTGGASTTEAVLLRASSFLALMGSVNPTQITADLPGGRVLTFNPYPTVMGTAADIVPAQVLRVEKGFAALPLSAQVTALEARFVSGGSGQGNAGVRLERFSGTDWVSRTTNASTDTALGDVVDVESDSATLASLMRLRALHFRVVPRSLNSTSLPAKLATDYAEVRLRYTLP